MELSQRDRLSELVEELTTSGQGELNQDKMKEIKKLCKVSNDCIDHVYHSIMSQLNQDHSEIRFSAFQMASELFNRSHHFRTLLVDNFQEFLELTVETDLDQPLPPPKEIAKKLKSLAIKTVQSWQASYGSAYKKLALGYHFLKQVKKVDFQDAEARTVAERRREEERRSHLERIYKEKADAATKEMEDCHEEIQATLTEMDSCMKLLFPEFELTNVKEDSPESSSPNSQAANAADSQPCSSKDLINETKDEELDEKQATNEEHSGDTEKTKQKSDSSQNEDDGDDDKSSEEEEPLNEDVFIRTSGLISHAYSLDLNLSSELHVKENEDNEAVLSTIKDLHRLITTKHLPAVQGWVQVLTKGGAEQRLLRRALDLKRSLEAALQKHEELHIDYKTRVRKVMKVSSDGDEDDEDEDFDEVPEKEGYEPHIPEHLRAEYGLDPLPSTSSAPVPKPVPVKRPAAPPVPIPSTSSSSRKLKRLREEEQDPTSAAATIRLLKDKMAFPTEPSSSSEPSTSRPTHSKKKAKDVPVVPFGLDIYYWGQDQPTAGKIIKSASQHQFWVPVETGEEEVENKELAAESRSRYISFPGRFTPVSHFCRAPLGNGKLCQRQDRVKCPFHGRIIPRDQDGKPCKPEDRQREEQEELRRRQEQPDWRDPELMRDIEAATGEDLGSNRVGKKGKGKGKKKKFPNLSDLKQNANTSRCRLEKKIFNKSSMRRVAEVMIKADRRKHDKFSNQFNYALN